MEQNSFKYWRNDELESCKKDLKAQMDKLMEAYNNIAKEQQRRITNTKQTEIKQSLCNGEPNQHSSTKRRVN